MTWRDYNVTHGGAQTSVAVVRATSCADAVWRAKRRGLSVVAVESVDGRHALRSGDSVADGSVPIPYQVAGLSAIAASYCAAAERQA
jgi:hypothetical protein